MFRTCLAHGAAGVTATPVCAAPITKNGDRLFQRHMARRVLTKVEIHAHVYPRTAGARESP